MGLYSDNAQRTSKCGKYTSHAYFFVLTTFRRQCVMRVQDAWQNEIYLLPKAQTCFLHKHYYLFYYNKEKNQGFGCCIFGVSAGITVRIFKGTLKRYQNLVLWARTIFGVIIFPDFEHHPFKMTHSIYILAGQTGRFRKMKSTKDTLS